MGTIVHEIRWIHEDGKWKLLALVEVDFVSQTAILEEDDATESNEENSNEE